MAKVVEVGNTSSPKMLEMLRRPEGATLEELLKLRRVTDKPKSIRLAAVLKVVKEFKNSNGYNVQVSGDRYFINTSSDSSSEDQDKLLHYANQVGRRGNIPDEAQVLIIPSEEVIELDADPDKEESNLHPTEDVDGAEPQNEELLEAIEKVFQDQVARSMAEAPETRLRRLAQSERIPHRVAITTYAYARNADVVAEVLFRAQGVCNACKSHAPFTRRSDGSPYLEVHHRTPLSEDGEDTVENAIAVCPNCHRKAHYA